MKFRLLLDANCYQLVFQGIFDFLPDFRGRFAHILRRVGGKTPPVRWEKRKIQGEMKW